VFVLHFDTLLWYCVRMTMKKNGKPISQLLWLPLCCGEAKSQPY